MKIDSRQQKIAFQKNPVYQAAKAKLNAPISDNFTLRNTPGSSGLTPRQAINIAQPTGTEYAGFKTTNPVMRLLKAVSRLIKKI